MKFFVSRTSHDDGLAIIGSGKYFFICEFYTMPINFWFFGMAFCEAESVLCLMVSQFWPFEGYPAPIALFMQTVTN